MLSHDCLILLVHVEADTGISFDELEVNDGDVWDEVNDEELAEDFNTTENTIMESDLHTPPDSPGSPIRSSFHNLLCLLVTLLAKWSSFYKLPDSSLNSFLKVLCFFFHLLAKLFSPLAELAKLFPSSVYILNKLCGSESDNFQKFVVCPCCNSIYILENCFETIGMQKVPKKCSYIAYPNHPQHARRKPCGAALLAEVTLSNGVRRYYPKKVFCYLSLINSLRALLQRNGVLQSLQHWQHRTIPDGVLGDVYDGRVWKEFLNVGGQPFLANTNNLALMLNADWFNPYKHSPYSVGVIYLVVLNLPRSERYKVENLLLVGIIPGPSEPSLNLNSYLAPLVEELVELWNDGVAVMRDVNQIVVKAALLCVSCDIPAARKVCGFLSHAARLGCSKCTKEFPCAGFGQRVSYAGFEAAPLRTEKDHRQHAQEALEKTTAKGRAEVESRHGSRYTVLMLLPYFDIVRCHVIDPMHNLFLGTARHMVKNIWLPDSGEGTLSRNSLEEVQRRVDSCVVPASMGRIPNKIAANFSSFKADQWKSWTLTFSVYALFGLIRQCHFDCWRKFVMACRLLAAPVLSPAKIEEAHQLLYDFCTTCESMYGPDAVTINMHLHLHLKQCLYDFGPISSFWLFGFERFNGILGKYPNNNRSIEIQIMRKFCKDLYYRGLAVPNCSMHDLPTFDFLNDGVAGTLREILGRHALNYDLSLAPLTPLGEIDSSLWACSSHVSYAGAGHKVLMEEHELNYLLAVYNILYEGTISAANLSSFCIEYKQLEWNGEVWGSLHTMSARSSTILAAWCGKDGQVDTHSTGLRPGAVTYYLKHYLHLPHKTPVQHFFAAVKWYMPHPDKNLFGDPIEVWCSNFFEIIGPTKFIPINRLHSQFVAGYHRHNEETVLCVCPTTSRYYV